MVPDSGPFDELVELRGSLDREREVIAEVEFLGGQKIGGRRILAAREPLYGKADVVVDTSSQAVEESLAKLRQAVMV